MRDPGLVVARIDAAVEAWELGPDAARWTATPRPQVDADAIHRFVVAYVEAMRRVAEVVSRTAEQLRPLMEQLAQAEMKGQKRKHAVPMWAVQPTKERRR